MAVWGPAACGTSTLGIAACHQRECQALPPPHPPTPRCPLQVQLPDICRTCGVAEGTIRQIYREIYPHLKTLIDKAGRFATHADIDTLPVPVEVSKT